MGAGVSGLPPLPEGFVLDSEYDPMKDILSAGYEFTNGYRTKQDIADLKARGYSPAEHSKHLEGDAIDLVPGKSGKRLSDVEAYAQQILSKWPAGGKVLNEGDHVHLQLNGWGKAPGTPGSPYSGMPDIPPGFELSQRGSVSSKDIQPAIRRADYSEMSPGGLVEEKTAAPSGSKFKSVSDPAAALALDGLIRAGTDYGVAVAQIKERFPEYPAFSPTAYKNAVEYHAAHPHYKGSLASAVKYEPLTTVEQVTNDFAHSGVGAFTGHALNAATAGLPVLAAGEEGNYFEDVSAQEHPYLSTVGDLTGNVAGAVTVGKGLGAGAEALAATESKAAPAAAWVAEHPGVTQVAADLGTGALYGAAEAGPGNRLKGAALGAATTAALETGGRLVVAPAFRTGKEFITDAIERRAANAAEEAAGAPLEGEVVSEATAQPEAIQGPESAAMASEPGPSISERPRDYIVPSTNVEQAAAAKGQEIAHPVTPEDVATPSLGDVVRAGNINLSKIETPNDIDALMKFTTDSFDGFKGERRGVQSWGATQKLAEDLGMTPDDLLARRTGQAYNAEEAMAARNLLAASATETRKLADAAVNGTEEDKSAFVKSFFLHAAITEKASGAAAEAGRALNVYAKIAKASLGDTAAMQAAIKRLQNGASVDDIAHLVNSLSDDPAALNRFARNAIKPAFKDKLMFLWINSLLSGPKTHIVNMSSNLVTMTMGAPEAMLATGIGKARSAITGSTDRLYSAEWFPRFFGTIKGAADGLSAAKEGFAKEAGGKIDAPQPAIGGRMGDIISIPTRLLNAEDEFFKAAIKQGELAGLAARKAKTEGLKGSDVKARIDYLMQSPTDDMLQSAAESALYKTFQRPLGPAMQKVSSAIQATPVLKLFVPFIRTPTNLLKYAIERTPAAPLLKEVRADFMAGGAKRDIAIARMTLGTGIGAIMAGLAANGHITGNGPADPSAKRALEAEGWQPYSFKIGNEYISYRRLDPWATIIGTSADAVELQSAMTDKQSQDAGAMVIGAMTQNLASKTWLSGLSDLIDAITDPKANAKNVITRLGTSIATPSLVAQVEGAVDPTVRDTSDPTYLGQLRKKIEARVPGLSSNVIPRRDILGHEVKSEMGPIARLISPFDVRAVNPDPVAKAIYDSGARFSLPGRNVGGGRLPDDAFDAYQQVAAQRFYDAMQEEMASADWQGMSKRDRSKLIERVKNRSRKDTREELFGF